MQRISTLLLHTVVLHCFPLQLYCCRVALHCKYISLPFHLLTLQRSDLESVLLLYHVIFDDDIHDVHDATYDGDGCAIALMLMTGQK